MSRGDPDEVELWPVPRGDERPVSERERARLAAETEAARRRISVEGHGPFPYLGDGVVRRVNMIDNYAELASLTMDRVRYIGRVLADKVAAAGYRPEDVLVGDKYVLNPRTGDTEPISEEVRGLVALEAAERDRAAKLLGDGVKIGIAVKQAEAVRSYADTVSVAQQELLRELGLDPGDEAASRAAMRAVLTARRQLGYDDGDPDAVAGAALTREERHRVLSRGMAAIA